MHSYTDNRSQIKYGDQQRTKAEKDKVKVSGTQKRRVMRANMFRPFTDSAGHDKQAYQDLCCPLTDSLTTVGTEYTVCRILLVPTFVAQVSRL